ncbi:hypothetical protein [Sulfitobacter sp. TBRI5]|uniref:hypothetical protein n=1 Tax=Sulfitobacter sp. TBRI5 TaxID=2989732 RepID=UPI003D9B1D9B
MGDSCAISAISVDRMAPDRKRMHRDAAAVCVCTAGMVSSALGKRGFGAYTRGLT